MESFKEVEKIEQKMRHLERQMATESKAEKLQKLLNMYSSVQNQFVSLGGYEIEEKLYR